MLRRTRSDLTDEDLWVSGLRKSLTFGVQLFVKLFARSDTRE